MLSASLNKTFLSDHCLYSYAVCHELTSELFLVGPKPIPDVKQLQVLLLFELVESYIQNVPQVFSGVEIRTASWSMV